MARSEATDIVFGRVLESQGLPQEIAIAAIPDDDRIWVEQEPNVWFRPLMFNTVLGQWCNLLRVTRSGV
ncbi:MAG TPA: hypothetical protein VIL44_07770, partial [Micromonospora sp.]